MRSFLWLSLVLTLPFLSSCMKKPVVWSPPPQIGDRDKPFNLLWPQAGDLNRLPTNPVWATQLSNPQQLPPPASPEDCVREPNLPVCTDQIPSPPEPRNKDVALFPNILICGWNFQAKIHGHANWLPASYTGAVQWWNFADDGDYNFALLPGNYQGLTQYNDELPGGSAFRFIELEFDSAETADRFTTPWWTAFKQTVDAGNFGAIQALLSPGDPSRAPQAVVTGLFGLDCEHDCRSEVHPVYALAIETNDSAEDDTWAIFVRNWGDEGFCSALDHQMEFDQNQVRLFLPRMSKGSFTVLPSSEFAASDPAVAQFPAITLVQGQGTQLTFNLPPPEQHPLAELVLHLKWTGDTYKRPKVKIRNLAHAMTSLRSQQTSPAESAAGTQDAEAYLGQLYRNKMHLQPRTLRLSPEAVPAQKTAAAAVPASVQVKNATSQEVASELKGIKVPRTPSVSRVASAKLMRDCEYIRAVCSAYDNNPPGDKVRDFPQLCQQLKEPDACTRAVQQAESQLQ